MQSESTHRRALITGAASGIGAEIARRLAADGYRIIAADRNFDGAQAVVVSLDGAPHTAFAIDVADAASVEQAFAAAEASGPVDVLVHAAAVLLTEPDGLTPRFWELDLRRWDTSMAINSRGSFLVTRAFMQHRERRPVTHGRVILFSSVIAQTGGSRTTYADYAASKAAVLGFMRVAARECASLGITVNAIAPGQIDTPMLRKNIPAGVAVDASAIPLARFGQPADVAAAVRYLASPDASFITGATLDVNGGQRMQ
jgi:NAD(P)-dependent dehydrogenase (short-subunit alcohol dehydrogenase family)